MSLAERLAAHERLPVHLRRELASHLEDPAVFPLDGELRDMALAARPQGARSAHVGGTVFVAYTEEGRAVAYRAYPFSVEGTMAIPLAGEALSVAHTARGQAIRQARVLRRPHGATRSIAWYGRHLAPLNEPGPELLDGRSFGLAMTLAEISVLEGAPLRSNVVALGCVDREGVVHAIEGTSEKCALVREWLLGVDTVIVAREQHALVQGLLAGRCEVVGVESVGEARDVALAPVGPARPMAEAISILSLSLESRPTQPQWEALVARANRVLELESEPVFSAAVSVAKAIVQRHLGGEPESSRFQDVRLDGLPRPLRQRILAHQLQALADHPADESERLAMEAVRDVDALDGSREDRILMGAAARCLAVRRHEEAARFAQEATEGWFANFEIRDSSFALCTWIRCLAVLGKREAFERAVEEFVEPYLDGARDEVVSSWFVRFEVGRGRVLLGDHERAIARLIPLADGVASMESLGAHAIRWLARAKSAAGDHPSAERQWARLERVADEHATILATDMQRRLGRLEHALLMRPELVPERVRAVLAHPSRGRLAHAVFASSPSKDRAASWLARAYPY